MKLKAFLFFALFGNIFFAQSVDESWKLYDDSEVAIIEITINPDNLSWIYNNVQSDSMHYASFHFKNKWIDETVDSIGFRLRGNTSRDAAKKSFKISFNSLIKGRQFYNIEKLNLNGEHNDPSIVRSKLCWDIYDKIGMPAPRAAHAAVYINGYYYGLYISTEHIDEEFLQKNYADDSGNLWRCLWPADLTYRGSNPEDYFPYSSAETPYALKTNEDEYDYSMLAKLISTITLTPTQYWIDSLENILDIPEFLKYLAVNTLVGSWDDYRSLMNNYYLYYEPKSKIFRWIPYDYDNTFGIDWFDVDWANANPYSYPKANSGSRPLSDKIMQNAQYRNLYSHFIEFINSNIMLDSEFDRNIDTLHTMITPFAEADNYRTRDYQFTVNQFHRSYTSISFSEKHVKRGIKEFIRLRAASLPNLISYQTTNPIVYKIDYEPKFPSAEDSIHVFISAFSNFGIENVKILFNPGNLTITNQYPMKFSPVVGTKIVEESDRWVGVIPPLGKAGFGNFQIEVNDLNYKYSTFPRNKLISISAPQLTENQIVINEILAKNDSLNQDLNGQYEDWLELYNSTNETIDLSGLFLSDDKANLTKWQFGDGVVISPNKHLIVWCDKDGSQQGIHTNFKLSVDGEFVAITDKDGKTIIDSITFPLQSANISYGRFPDGENSWRFMDPSPEAKNFDFVNVTDDYSVANFELFQNYPNPFNPSTTIEYSIPRSSEYYSVKQVQLKIYDILGREVATLVNKQQKAGNYEVNFDAKNLGSGIYFYKLQSGSFSQSKKMILVK
ncbi:MAG: CotH kinase family protein [Bacteroidetes bacterium]|nr:CotH kinase family protein [Bacteroidota bacterium]MBU1115569.1 CotH kinase family protein [Bacteroidota bacterium]MBU1799649.1 CotH kinase family protein [Bacteroidota bacterium]